MNKYEILYIISTETTDEAKDAIVEKFSSLVTTSGGEIDKIDKWGIRRLAYPINDKNEGFYVLMQFSGDAALLLELRRQINITVEIIRQIIIKKD